MNTYEVTILRGGMVVRNASERANSVGSAIAKACKSYTRFTSNETLRFGVITILPEEEVTVKVKRIR